MPDALLLDPVDAPLPRTRLIGRETERRRAHQLLIEDTLPLLTVTGPGGVGKTRLALAIAGDVVAHFADGVAWVDLAPVRDPALVPLAAATALGITPPPDRPVVAELALHVQPRQMLLLLDNCEHVLEGVAGLVAELLGRCPALQVLASSRAPLRVRGEHVLPVDPLPLPAGDAVSPDAVAGSDAIRLFVERAQAVRPEFELTTTNAATVTAICRALDGLPLALELAAARVTILSPAALLAQMTHRLSILRNGPRDAPARQQTIDAAIVWSYELLDSTEQTLFRRLAVFSGGFTLEAAWAVAGDEPGTPSDLVPGLSALVDQSLVSRMDRGNEPRFTLLETIREFALARLGASGEETATRDRHARFFCALAKAKDARVAAYLPDAQEILDQLELEFPNLRAALAWQRDTGNAAGLLELAAELTVFWQLRGHLRDGRAWLEWGLAHSAELNVAVRARGQLALAAVLQPLDGAAAALPLCEAALNAFLASDDKSDIACAFLQAAVTSLPLNDAERTARYIDAALTTLAALDDDIAWAERAACHVLWIRGIQAKDQGNFAGAERDLRDLIARQRSIASASGKEQPHACGPFLTLGSIHHCQNDVAAALTTYQAALAHAWRCQVASVAAVTTARVAGMVAAHGRWQEAAWMFGAIEAYCDRIGFDFRQHVWPLTRAFGLPQPWQGTPNFTGQTACMWTATVRHLPNGLPPLPDPDAATTLWLAGKSLSMAEAVAHALAVDLSIVRASRSTAAMVKLTLGAAATVALTPREHEVLAMLCQRLTNAEMADRLCLSRRTVEDHVTHLLGKLDVANRREAAALAARLGLIAHDQPEPT